MVVKAAAGRVEVNDVQCITSETEHLVSYTYCCFSSRAEISYSIKEIGLVFSIFINNTHGPLMMQVILVRHAETEWNVREILQGQSDSALTSRGNARHQLYLRRLQRVITG